MNEEIDSLLTRLENAEDPALLQFVPDIEKNNAVLEGLPVAVLLRDLEDGKVLGVNSACRALIGADRDDLTGRTLTECGVDLLRTGTSGRVAAPGDPVKVTVIDSNKARIPCLMFRRRLEVGLRKVEATVLVESGMLGERTYRGGKNERLYSGALQSVAPGHLLCELEFSKEDESSQSEAPTDMLLIEAKGLFDSTISGRISVGDSVCDVLPFPTCQAMMGAAGQSLKSGGPVELEVEGLGSVMVLSEKPSKAMFCILPPAGTKERAEQPDSEDVIVASSSEEGGEKDYTVMAEELFGDHAGPPEGDEPEIVTPPASEDQTQPVKPPESEETESRPDTPSNRAKVSDALFVCLDKNLEESGASMLGMLGFNAVPVCSAEEAVSAIEDSDGTFAFVVAEVGINDVGQLASVMSSLSQYKLIVMADEETAKKLNESDIEPTVIIAKPYSINDLATAISEVYR
ncbi:PAS domain-containing protein [Candidatus Fermentibacteria bacterium]|nr:PAS domain-containing protein [Candidatus Fermentibacteria bacterium]